jgi:hypothetical protein
MTTVSRLSAITFLLVAATACRGPAGPSLTGTMGGVVRVYDQFGAPLANDTDVTVIALPTANSVTTDNAGLYSFPSLATGVYSIEFMANGVGTYLVPDIQFLGGGSYMVPAVNIGQVATASVSNFALTPSATGDTVFATGVITPAPPPGLPRYVRIFYSTSVAVGSTVGAYQVTGPTNSNHAYPVTTGTFSIPVTGPDLRGLLETFGAATTIQVVAFGESYYENSYTDAGSGQQVYPNVSAVASNVVAFKVP